MQKPFTQITFDFTSPEIEKEEKHVSSAREENITAVNETDTTVEEEPKQVKSKTHKPRGRRSLKDAAALWN